MAIIFEKHFANLSCKHTKYLRIFAVLLNDFLKQFINCMLTFQIRQLQIHVGQVILDQSFIQIGKKVENFQHLDSPTFRAEAKTVKSLSIPHLGSECYPPLQSLGSIATFYSTLGQRICRGASVLLEWKVQVRNKWFRFASSSCPSTPLAPYFTNWQRGSKSVRC